MTKLVLPFLLLLIVIVAIAVNSSSNSGSNQITNTPSSSISNGSVNVTTDPSGQGYLFATPKKIAHLLSSDPAHGATITGVPTDVKISFDTELGVNSNIAITREGKDYSIGNTIVSGDRLTMTKTVQADTPDGLYTVSYTACWPDGSCYDGSFQFAIKR